MVKNKLIHNGYIVANILLIIAVIINVLGFFFVIHVSTEMGDFCGYEKEYSRILKFFSNEMECSADWGIFFRTISFYALYAFSFYIFPFLLLREWLKRKKYNITKWPKKEYWLWLVLASIAAGWLLGFGNYYSTHAYCAIVPAGQPHDFMIDVQRGCDIHWADLIGTLALSLLLITVPLHYLIRLLRAIFAFVQRRTRRPASA